MLSSKNIATMVAGQHPSLCNRISVPKVKENPSTFKSLSQMYLLLTIYQGCKKSIRPVYKVVTKVMSTLIVPVATEEVDVKVCYPVTLK